VLADGRAGAADTIGVADVDTALNRARGRRSSTRRSGGEALLAEWARRQLAEGVEELHAQVRERSTMPCWRPRCRSPTAAAKPLPARASAAIPSPASWAPGAAAGAIERSLHAILAPACRTVDRSWTMHR
jgi:hypothetical protein